jgi:hypothetical protein
MLGYNLENWYTLYEDIIKGTDFKAKRLSEFSEKKLTFICQTVLRNKTNNNNIHVQTCWNVDEDFSIHFVTMIMRRIKDVN